MLDKILIAFSNQPKIGSRTFKKISTRYPKLEKVFSASYDSLCRDFGQGVALAITEAKKFDAEKELRKLEILNIKYVTVFDRNFPKLLKEIPDCPYILYYQGDIKILDRPTLGVVGSRKYSVSGKQNALNLSRSSASCGLVIVSGLALGIDTFSHQGALEAGGLTVAVLGSGLNNIYPSVNTSLAKDIIKSKGLVISEYPPDEKPNRQNFPMRNRIIAGLSKALLVVEAREKSGALITAYLAIDYNRDLLAIPGSISDQSSKGTNKLLKEGAVLVTDYEDILSAFGLQKSMKNSSTNFENLSNDEKLVLSQIKDQAVSLSDLAKKLNKSVAFVSANLSFLEIKGLIRNDNGRYYLVYN